jgi:large subunit ribosomal protein L6
MSRIGRKPVAVPKEVKIDIKGEKVSVQGPKGTLERTFSPRISFELKDGQVNVGRATNIATDRALQGLSRALLFNMIKGVTDGYVKELEIVGVGFKAQLQGANLNLTLGFSHPVVVTPPAGIKIETPKNTVIIIRGTDKEKVGEIAAEIRSIYPPEPYKGKGIRYTGEQVRKKVGKAQATGK